MVDMEPAAPLPSPSVARLLRQLEGGQADAPCWQNVRPSQISNLKPYMHAAEAEPQQSISTVMQQLATVATLPYHTLLASTTAEPLDGTDVSGRQLMSPVTATALREASSELPALVLHVSAAASPSTLSAEQQFAAKALTLTQILQHHAIQQAAAYSTSTVTQLVLTWFNQQCRVKYQYDLCHCLASYTAASTSKHRNHSAQSAIAYAIQQLLHYNFAFFSSLYDYSTLYIHLQHPSVLVRFYVGQSLAQLIGMQPIQRTHFFTNTLLLEQHLKQLYELDTRQRSDVRDECAAVYSRLLRSATRRSPAHRRPVQAKQRNADSLVQQHLVDVFGVQLLRKQRQHAEQPQSAAPAPASKSARLVMTDSTQQNLYATALAVSGGRPVLLEGTAGSGKSATIQHLSQLTGNDDIVYLQLDDQIDSRTLIGTYTCTDVPAEFVFQPGVLTQAVQQGRWLVIEDIDRIPFEVLSALLPLLQSRQLLIAGRGTLITAAVGFQLFATRTQHGHTGYVRNESSNIIDSLFTRVVMQALDDEEIERIVAEQYNNIPHFVLPQIIQTYHLLTSSESSTLSTMLSQSTTNRSITFRDFVRWCQRLQQLFANISLPTNALTNALKEGVLQCAIEVFASAVPSATRRSTLSTDSTATNAKQQIVVAIANIWQVTDDRVDYFLAIYTPTFNATEQQLTVGHIALPSHPANGRSTVHNSTRTGGKSFARTKQALRLLEFTAAAIQLNEPVLLVGETGCGKTTIVQHLAAQLNVHLTVINLNQQSDSSDLLGGYKPVDSSSVVTPLLQAFGALFPRTFSRAQNAAFLRQLQHSYRQKQYQAVVDMIQTTMQNVHQKFSNGQTSPAKKVSPAAKHQQLYSEWLVFERALASASKQLANAQSSSFMFAFQHGALVEAVRKGHWLLLDEINLASSETLQRLSGILEDATGSIALTEKGEINTIQRHPNFRLFAAMNPPTDQGKRQLPPAIRSRFSEVYVEEASDVEDLAMIVRQYIQPTPQLAQYTNSLVDFYLAVRAIARSTLMDGGGQHPTYSLRTLVRTLQYATTLTPAYGPQRALYEALCMTFITPLSDDSTAIVLKLVHQYLHFDSAKMEKQPLPPPILHNDDQFVHVNKTMWVTRGSEAPNVNQRYIITASINARLKQLSRVLAARRYPVLLQGPTSAGKTSLIEWLGHATGNKVVRINNHEHTDLSEYLGTYITDPATGRLHFKEGVLVEAVRNGWWIVLDELNLASSDVLEALNRLLDDNRELFIPESQVTVTPHPSFLLFATQNPPGLYGGRKVLSRAFVNRFVVMHVDDIPASELRTILHLRCSLPESYCSAMLSAMHVLQQRRASDRVFAGKHSFITPRDLFRWGERQPRSYLDIAMHGYMLLGERLRTEEGKAVVKQTMEKECKKTKLDEEQLYNQAAVDDMIARLRQHFKCDTASTLPDNAADLSSIAWTQTIRRLFTLAGHCILAEEPVLLVGSTGSGKTTVCQVLSSVLQRRLHIINCHQHTESSDFLGSLRPIRRKQANTTQLADAINRYMTLVQQQFPEVPVQSMTDGMSIDECMQSFNDVQAAVENRNYESNADEAEDGNMVTEPATNGHSDDHAALLASLRAIASEVRQVHADSTALFEWSDGALVTAMRQGDLVLIDEISLADDAVLERLNSVLETSRTLYLAEQGLDSQAATIKAHPDFRVFATMNPSGDFGKKELSPAMRNRFTEVWVPTLSNRQELLAIVHQTLRQQPALLKWSEPLLDFVQWFQATNTDKQSLSLRDILSWGNFMLQAFAQLSSGQNNMGSDQAAEQCFLHGACLTVLDGLGIGAALQADSQSVIKLRAAAVDRLLMQIPEERRAMAAHTLLPSSSHAASTAHSDDTITRTDTHFGIAPFIVERGAATSKFPAYVLQAPSTRLNLHRVLRALSLPRSILLEGSPGVGKSSLIGALAAACSRPLVRINLSEQTDMMDLLGSDLPVSGSKRAGEFAWSDGVFLTALKKGDWVLLDELNLASQSVLEGLNAVLDHRASVYIPELDQTFHCPPSFRIFAAQNPMAQGGGRKGLPASFLNRFTKVYVAPLTASDLRDITSTVYPSIPAETVQQMISFNNTVADDISVHKKYGRLGSPFEFNLRDIFRWCTLLEQDQHQLPVAIADKQQSQLQPRSRVDPAKYLDLIYLQRMRSGADRNAIADTYRRTFDCVASAYMKELGIFPYAQLTSSMLQVGDSWLDRQSTSLPQSTVDIALCSGALSHHSLLLHQQRTPLQHLITCINQAWPVLLVGPTSSGKSECIQLLASLACMKLHQLFITSAADSSDLLGSFEQMDLNRHMNDILNRVGASINAVTASALLDGADAHASAVQQVHHQYHRLQQRHQAAADEHLAHTPVSNEVAVMLQNVLQQLAALCTDAEALPVSLQPVQLLHEVEELLGLLHINAGNNNKQSSNVIGRFEWVDGVLIQALERGEWVVLDNTNLCSATVLDRLNALLETNGTLMVNECGLINGQPRIIKPHKNFRLFLSIDTVYGEVSRAMRNRCVEIVMQQQLGADAEHAGVEDTKLQSTTDERPALLPIPASGPAAIAPSMHDCLFLLNGAGVTDGTVATIIATVHRHLATTSTHRQGQRSMYNIRHLLQWAALLLQQAAASAENLLELLWQSMQATYHLQQQQAESARNMLEQLLHECSRSATSSFASEALSAQSSGGMGTAGEVQKQQQVQQDGVLVRYLVYRQLCQSVALIQDSVSVTQMLQQLTEQDTSSHLSSPARRALNLLQQVDEQLQVMKHDTQQMNGTTAATLASSQSISHLQYAILRFVRCASPSDYRAAVHWIKALQQELKQTAASLNADVTAVDLLLESSCQLLSSVLEDVTVKAYVRTRSHLAQSVGIRQQLTDNAPLDPYINAALHHLLCEHVDVAELCSLWSSASLRLSMQLRQLYEQRRLQHSAASKLKSLTVVQQSYAVHQRTIAYERLSHPVIACLHSLFRALDAYLDARTAEPVADVTCKALQQLIDTRNDFYDSVDVVTSDVDVETLSIRWHQLSKHINQLVRADEHADARAATIQHLQHAVQQTHIACLGSDAAASLLASHQLKNRLWKYNGHPLLPRSTQVLHLYSQLKQLSQRVECWSNEQSQVTSGFAVASREWKQTLVDALCNVQFLLLQHQQLQISAEADTQAQRATEQLLESLSQVPDALAKQLESATVQHRQATEQSQLLIRLQSEDDLSLEDLGMTVEDDVESSMPSIEQLLVQLSFRGDTAGASRTQRWTPQLLPIYDLTALLRQRSALVQLLQLSTAVAHSPSSLSNAQLAAATALLRSTVHQAVELTSTPLTLASAWQTSLWMTETLQNTLDDTRVLSARALSPVTSAAAYAFYRQASSQGFSQLLLPARTILIQSLVQTADHVPLMHRFSRRHELGLLVNHLASNVGSGQHTADEGVSASVREIVYSLMQMLSCFEDTFAEEQYQQLQATLLELTTLTASTVPSAAQLVAIIRTSTDARLAAVVGTLIEPLISTLLSCCHQPSATSAGHQSRQLGELHVLLALCHFHLLLPTSAFDKNKQYAVRLQDLYHRRGLLQKQCNLAAALEAWTSGNATNVDTTDMEQVLNQTHTQTLRIKSKAALRSASARPYTGLHQLIHRYAAHQGSIATVTALMHQLASDDATAAQAAQLQHTVWQENSAAFLQRMHQQYSEYDDVTHPLSTSVLQLQYGLTMVAHYAQPQQQVATTLYQTLRSVIDFPFAIAEASSDKQLLRTLPTHTLHAIHQLGQQSAALVRSQHKDQAEQEPGQEQKERVRIAPFLAVSSSLLLSQLQQLSISVASSSSQLQPSQLSQLDALFTSFINLWRRQEAEKEEREAEKNALYKYKTRSFGEDGDETLQQELMLAELYPSFDSDYSDLQPADAADEDLMTEQQIADKRTREALQQQAQQKQQDKLESEALLSEESMYEVYKTFIDIFSPQRQRTALLSSQLVDNYLNKYAIAHTLLNMAEVQELTRSLPCSLDDESVAGHLLVSTQTYQQLQTGQDDEEQPAAAAADPTSTDATLSSFHELLSGEMRYTSANSRQRKQRRSRRAAKQPQDWRSMPDLYREANIGEARLVDEPITGMMLRLRHLLVEHPHHPLLLLLIRLCHRIATLPTTSPVMKLLAGVELLLQKSEEWESNAAKHVSLSAELLKLRSLVVRWRKMELQSWQRALTHRYQHYQVQGIRSFFHLYPLLNCAASELLSFLPAGSSATVAEQDARATEQYIKHIYSALDDFVQQSNIGQLPVRLRMLRAFSTQIKAELTAATPVVDRLPAGTRQRIADMIDNILLYYSQFLPAVEEHVSSRQSVIEQQLRDQVRLHVWDLTNYWALKESTQRAHHKLLKFTKDYDEILQTILQQILVTVEQSDVADGDNSNQNIAFGVAGQQYSKVKQGIENLRLGHDKQSKTRHRKSKADTEERKESADENTVDEKVSFSAEQPDLPSIAEALAIKLPDASNYLINPEQYTNWHIATPSLPELSSAVLRDLPRLYRRVRVISDRGLLHSAYTAARDQHALGVEELAVGVIERCNTLRVMNAKLNYKKKAYVDVMRTLKAAGLSHYSSASGVSSKQMTDHATPHTASDQVKQALLDLPALYEHAPLQQILTRHPQYISPLLHTLSEQCEATIYNSTAAVRKMRYRALAHHADLTAAEVHRGKGLIEHLYALAVQQRARIGQTTANFQMLQHWQQMITSLPTNDTDSAMSSQVTTMSHAELLWRYTELINTVAAFLQAYATLYTNIDSTTSSATIKADCQLGLSNLRALQGQLEPLQAALQQLMDTYFPQIPAMTAQHRQESQHLLDAHQSMVIEHIGQLNTALEPIFDQCLSALPYISPDAPIHRLAQRFQELKQDAEQTAAGADEHGDDFTELYDAVAASLVLAVQETHEAAQMAIAGKEQSQLPHSQLYDDANSPEAEVEQQQLSIVDEDKAYQATLSRMQLPTLHRALQRLVSSVHRHRHSQQHSQHLQALHNLVPLMEQVSKLVERSITQYLAYHRVCLKLNSILLSVFNTLLVRGFCRQPDDTDDSKEGSDEHADDESKEGTGMGDGDTSQAKDVSDQLEDESQIEGTRGDNQEQQPPQPEDYDPSQGLEMNDDFEGDLQDMPKPEEGDKQPDDNGQEEEELDRQYGDLQDDQDKNVIDEKLWNASDDEQDEQGDGQEEEKTERDAPMQGDGTQEQQLQAKEDEQSGEKPDKDQPTSKDKSSDQPKDDAPTDEQDADETAVPEPDETDDGDTEQQAGEQDSKYEDNHGINQPYELPDDLQLDGEDGSEMEVDDADHTEADGEAEGEETQDAEQDTEAPDSTEEPKEEDNADSTDPTSADLTEPEEQSEEPPTTDEQEQETPPTAADENADDSQQEQGGEDPTADEELPAADEEHAPIEQQSSEAERSAGAGAATAPQASEQQSMQQDASSNVEQPSSAAPQPEAADQASQEARDAMDATSGQSSAYQPHSQQPQQGTAQNQKQQQQQQQPRQPRDRSNPYQSVGDASKHWQERLQRIERNAPEMEVREQEVIQPDEAAEDMTDVAGAVEDVADDERADTQMMDDTDQQQHARQLPVQEQDEEQKQREEDRAEAHHPEPTSEEAAQEANRSTQRGGKQRIVDAAMEVEEDSSSDDDEVQETAEEEEKERYDPYAEGEQEDNADEAPAPDTSALVTHEGPAPPPLDPVQAQEQLQQLREQLDTELQQWHSTNEVAAIEHATRVYSQLESVTYHLAHHLCEQLRTILEPTVATKLRGDYRTGKRLNIKKVIPYIASQYRKDKIWLRRTAPNQRHYQVMIAIDDSASMLGTEQKVGAGRLALEAMTLLARALTQLEVGELAIASFGEQFRLLHDFRQPFDQQTGARVVQHFQFQQQSTHWISALNSMSTVLTAAKQGSTRSSGTGGALEHLQLVFVISDARVQQDREHVGRQVREGLARGQFLVLLIIDSVSAPSSGTGSQQLPNQQSILDTRSVSYPNGKMRISHYLDDFPFPYYIIVRNIDSLPEVIAGALRQWFELVTGDA